MKDTAGRHLSLRGEKRFAEHT